MVSAKLICDLLRAGWLPACEFYRKSRKKILYFRNINHFSSRWPGQWHFYVRQRDNAHEWKCQPDKFLSPEVERHEVILGTVSMLCVSLVSATISWDAANDGHYTTIYYEFNAHGWPWFFLQFAIIFMWQVGNGLLPVAGLVMFGNIIAISPYWQDYGTYWTHRIYHTPFLYKHFHKIHHKYKQPTAFSVTAIHPVEIIHMQLVLFSPGFIFPVHWSEFCALFVNGFIWLLFQSLSSSIVPFYGVLLYTYYHAIIDHSGITFKAHWWQPWQPDAIFHDNHHQYTHVNFGFNIFYWDKVWFRN